MNKYKTTFSSFHTLYRLTTTFGDLKSFSAGACRLFRNVFKAEKVVMICKVPSSGNFLKVRLETNGQDIRRGGLSILSRLEKEMLHQGKAIVSPGRLVAPFVFLNTLGIVSIRRKPQARAFDETEKAWFLSLSEEISVSLKIFHLYHEQHKMMISYIKSLSEFLTQHVPTSYLHSKVIFWLIKSFGNALRLSETEIKALERAALLHDAGKIQLPYKLLKKQRPLTDDEFKLITKHPRKGVELIKNMELLKPAIPVILHHHERWDGKGYPSGLKKEKIPIGSRILSILDTFDAMYFGRPYKKRRSLAEIAQEFKNQRGKQFDPKIVDVFLSILKRKSFKRHLKSSPKA